MKIPLPLSPRALAVLTSRMSPEAALLRPPVSERAFYRPRTGDISLPESFLVGGRDLPFLRDRTGLPLELDETAAEPFIGKASPTLADLMAGHERRHGMQYEGTEDNEPFRLSDPSYQRNIEALERLRSEPGVWPDPATDEMASAKAKILSNDEFDADVYGRAYERSMGQHENLPLFPEDEMMKLALLEALQNRRQIARTQYDLPYNPPSRIGTLPFGEA